MESITRCAIYARVSTDLVGQEKSVDNQIDTLFGYIHRHEWLFAGIYTDEGITGTSKKHRDQYNQMIADAKSKKFNCIVTKSFTRFSRNIREALEDLHILQNYGVRVIFLEDNLDTNKNEDRQQLGLIAWLAELEARKTSDRIRTTWSTYNRQGKMHATTPPFGYSYSKDLQKFVINEEEAEVVRRIFKLYCDEGYGMPKIATQLSLEKVPSKKGGTWAQATIKSILSNQTYTGDLVMGKFTHPDVVNKKKTKIDEENWIIHSDKHEAIITRETYEKAKKEMNKRSDLKSSSRHSTAAIFSGIIKCGECGSSCGIKRKKHFRNYAPFYECIEYSNRGKDLAGHIRNSIWEADLLEVIQAELQQVTNWNNEKLLQMYKSSQKKSKNKQSKAQKTLEQLKQQLETQKKRMITLTDTFMDGTLGKETFALMSKDVEVDIQRIQEDIREAQKEIRLQPQEELKAQEQLVKEANEILSSYIPTNQQMRSLIKSITIYTDNRIEIELNISKN